ncbi:hypothetical protein [Spiroplasma endosymbiont of Lariophagus distinguendus]|uniref:hypothetical protein n=1 Tax=Spiroplasma endosymbiont of Lariophagus distinguendus TaxID=2935082 RepID=UPI0020797E83|nr:hypothetical protein [Spiroplasma endosymbiont of Lariophagus distinguendus]
MTSSLLEYTINLHQDNNIIKNDEAFIKTEYEEKFIKQNKNINYLLIQKKKNWSLNFNFIKKS